jgi:hypothetical protein
MKRKRCVSEIEIDNLKRGEYIVSNKQVHVKALEITNTEQIFECPFCYEQYDTKGNGVGDRILHTHSYDQSFRQNTTVTEAEKTHIYATKTPHCGCRHDKYNESFPCFPKKYTNFCVHLTTTTKDSRNNDRIVQQYK